MREVNFKYREVYFKIKCTSPKKASDKYEVEIEGLFLKARKRVDFKIKNWRTEILWTIICIYKENRLKKDILKAFDSIKKELYTAMKVHYELVMEEERLNKELGLLI